MFERMAEKMGRHDGKRLGGVFVSAIGVLFFDTHSIAFGITGTLFFFIGLLIIGWQYKN